MISLAAFIKFKMFESNVEYPAQDGDDDDDENDDDDYDDDDDEVRFLIV